MFKYSVCEEAAYDGDLEELKKMHLAGCPWDKNTPVQAAENGHLDCLQYTHENGCPWDEDTTSLASKNGHLDCLQYAHEHGCPWNIFAVELAAENGHLDCLCYAIENGCHWNKRTLLVAAKYGNLDCLRYAFENTEGDYDNRIPFYACKNGQLDCFKYCFEVWCNPQAFWDYDYQNLTKIIDQIDLDDPVWRRLFNLDLNKFPELQSKVVAKKEENEKIQKILTDELVDNVKGPIGLLPTDVINDYIFPYL